MKCKYGQRGACEKLFCPNCPDDSSCYEFDLFTNADRIRGMSDKDLSEFINKCTSDNGPDFCRRLPECDADLERDTIIPLERCNECLLWYLRQPAEEEQHG